MDITMEFLNSEQAASLLQVRPSTLKRWRLEKRGPEFAVIGKQVLYSKQAIDEFFNECVVRREVVQ